MAFSMPKLVAAAGFDTSLIWLLYLVDDGELRRKRWLFTFGSWSLWAIIDTRRQSGMMMMMMRRKRLLRPFGICHLRLMLDLYKSKPR